jgi:hypothetical protein
VIAWIFVETIETAARTSINVEAIQSLRRSPAKPGFNTSRGITMSKRTTLLSAAAIGARPYCKHLGAR